MPGLTLTLNFGSSSLNFALFEAATLAPVLRGAIEDIDAAARLTAQDRHKAPLTERWEAGTPFETILHDLLTFTRDHAGLEGLAAVGHRIVHGGPDHVDPATVTPNLLGALEALTSLDPLHRPHNLAPVRVIAASRPVLPQACCFDTAFHHDMPAVAQAVPVPTTIAGREIRRYGFHGLSYEYIARHLARTAPDLAPGRVIVAHLGAGASLYALKGGASIATTMGFSVLDGLDALIFTAGIGEHAPAIRAAICARLAWLGLGVDVVANSAGAVHIGTAASTIDVRVIATDEEAMIALHTQAIHSDRRQMVAAHG